MQEHIKTILSILDDYYEKVNDNSMWALLHPDAAASTRTRIEAAREWMLSASQPVNADADGLLPCPHCGSNDVRVADVSWDDPGFSSYCFACKAHSGAFLTEAEAIAAWNKRGGVSNG